MEKKSVQFETNRIKDRMKWITSSISLQRKGDFYVQACFTVVLNEYQLKNEMVAAFLIKVVP